MNDMENLKEKIFAEYQQGNVCFMTPDGIATAKISEFIKQPLDGILYDLNRDRATITTFLDDAKWVNDLALTEVLRYQHNLIKELEYQLNNNSSCSAENNDQIAYLHIAEEVGYID